MQPALVRILLAGIVVGGTALLIAAVKHGGSARWLAAGFGTIGAVISLFILLIMGVLLLAKNSTDKDREP